MMTSSFGKPARFGIRTCRSGLPPATHAAVACVNAAEHPAVTSPHSAPVSAASRAPIDFSKLIEMHVLARRRVHRRAHFRQHQRSADDRERAARVDDGLHADRSIDVGGGTRRVLRRFGRRHQSGVSDPASVDRLSSVARSRPPRSRSRRLNGVDMCPPFQQELRRTGGPGVPFEEDFA